MLTKPYTRVVRQIVYNRKLEQIINYEDPDGEYVDPLMLLNQELFNEEISFEDAEKIIPFFEILILRDTSTSYFYRLTLDSEKDLIPTQWKQIGKCLQEALSAFEQEKFKTQGELFYDESALLEKLKRRQQEYRETIRLRRIIKTDYRDMMNKIKKMIKDGSSHVDIAKEVGLSEKKTKENLYSTTSGKPTISPLVLKILEDSDAAKTLGIRDSQRIYDDIILRSEYAAFRKPRKPVIFKRITAFPTDPVELHED